MLVSMAVAFLRLVPLRPRWPPLRLISLPLAFECFGTAATPAAANALRRVARLISLRPGVSRSSGHMFADLRRRLSFALQRSLGRALIRRDPSVLDPI